MHARIFNIDPGSFDIVQAARPAQRKLKVDGDDAPRSLEEAIANVEAVTNRIREKQRAPRSLEEAIANLEAVTSRILEKQRGFEDAQRRLEQQLVAVTGEIEARWQALEQQLAVAVTSLCRHD